ncbi:hypothetical protein ACGFIW_20560 [Micromonospora sp. NPDC048935]|uniref:hypothetical protein n=1 Tax=Micromonospora sp. NPDC048935 TaxID=3364262 RepID=UPI0037188659
MPDPAARFAQLADEYETRKLTATALVEGWDWYTWPGLDLRPLHFERDLRKPGRRLDTRPPLDRDVLRIGFDAQGRVAVVEEYSGFLNGTRHRETFFHHGDEVVEAAHFDTDGPIHLHEYRFEDGLMRTAAMVARRGSGRESYVYTDGRISRVEISHSGGPPAVLVAEHDDRGLLRLVRIWGRESQVRYARPPAGFDLEAACRAIEDMAVALIPDAAARLTVDAPVACLALSYDRPTQLVIDISAATADERAELASIEARAAWSPADFEASTGIDLGDTEPSRLVQQELALLDADDDDVAAGSEIGRRLWCGVAARLNVRDWSATLPVTDDFVVYAVDLELVDLERNLTACLPPNQLTKFRNQHEL